MDAIGPLLVRGARLSSGGRSGTNGRVASCFVVTQSNVQLVRHFLRAGNLEQLGRTQEAVELYETTIAAGFDASGPYDRLIAIYDHQARHHDVVRVAERALAQVQTHEAKRSWYEGVRSKAVEALRHVPEAAPKRRTR